MDKDPVTREMNKNFARTMLIGITVYSAYLYKSFTRSLAHEGRIPNRTKKIVLKKSTNGLSFVHV